MNEQKLQSDLKSIDIGVKPVDFGELSFKGT